MPATQSKLIDQLNPEGQIAPDALPLLREWVERYPYYHLARITLLRVLYRQRDPSFHTELRRAALFLPSREAIFNFIEAEKMMPGEENVDPVLGGATLSRKPNQRIGRKTAEGEEDRTGSLIDSFLNRLPGNEPDAARSVTPVRRGRADATTDYITYMLEEEMEAQAPLAAEKNNATQKPGEHSHEQQEGEATDVLIDQFIQKQGDRRIKLKNKNDNDLQKPDLAADNVSQQGAFTETLARIYIKQGKFEHAIEIIRRLSLKYPKKNRYFADQIRFLEKIIANNKAKVD